MKVVLLLQINGSLIKKNIRMQCEVLHYEYTLLHITFCFC